MRRTKYQKEAQKVQDKMFLGMSADKKIELASGMWLLANNLNSNKNGQNSRSEKRFGGHSKNS